MTEEIILEDKKIKITPSLVVLNGTTYAVANITSVRVVEKNGTQVLGVILALIGGLTLWSGGEVLSIGLLLLGVGVLLAIFGRTWMVCLTMGSTERSGFEHRDRPFVEKIASSIHEAIVRRSAQTR